MSEWQTIDTAPKDRLVDLWISKWVHPNPASPDTYRKGRRAIDCRWNDGRPRDVGYGIAASATMMQQACLPFWQSEHEGKIETWEATHWMEAPTNPFASPLCPPSPITSME